MAKISICIPAYNYAHYLCDAIDSCLAQDVDFSLIVLDNASSDATPQLKDKYDHDARVSWFRNEAIMAIQDNWNKAVSLANTEWVKILQADDRMLAGSIVQLNALTESAPSCAYIGHLSEIIDSSGFKLRRNVPYSSTRKIIHLSAGEGPALMLRSMARLREPTSNLYTKDAWHKIGGYSSKYRYTFDIHFNYRLMKHHDGLLYSEYFTQVRRHGSSDGSLLPPDLALNNLRVLVSEILDDLPNADRIHGKSMIQYRIIELFAQRFSVDPGTAIKFLLLNCHEFMSISSLAPSLQTLIRRMRTGDVQRGFD
jgi:glycosyltransferase involved in cell wall biosynthesis